MNAGTRRLTRKAQELMGPDDRVLGAAEAFAGMHPAKSTYVHLVASLVLVAIVYLLSEVLAVLGALPLLVLVFRLLLAKPRVVARMQNYLALIEQSRWTGRLKTVIARADHPDTVMMQGKWAEVDFGSEKVWVIPGKLA